MIQAKSNASSRHLVRGLTLIPAAALIITGVIGSGVFLKARVMTCNVGSPGMVLLAYVVAGIFTLAGALSFAELSTVMPRAGGQYNFIGAAFGRVWAFLYGWMATFIDGAGSMAALAIVFAIFFNDLIGGTLAGSQAQMLTVGVLLVVMVLNFASAHFNGIFASVVTALKVALVIGIALGAFFLSDGTWGHYAQTGAAGACEGVASGVRLGMAGFGAAIVGALWSYNGWAMVTMVAEEVGDPERTLPRALFGGTMLLIILYVLINASFFYVLTPEAVASVAESSSVAGQVVVRFLGAGGAAVMAIGMMTSVFGALHGTALSNSRLPFAMARDGMLPRRFSVITKKSHIPANAVILMCAAAIILALSGTFDILTDLIVFGLLLFNGLGVASVMVLRKKMPDVARPFKVPGYPVVPALFLLATIYLLINTLVTTPGRALAGLAIIAAGLPVYFYYSRKLGPSRPEDFLGESGDSPILDRE
ncbi:MAG: amino acid permease [Rhodothermia bacterium]|nr:MAG: amino acid permease [Rhodothermia bacterium]